YGLSLSLFQRLSLERTLVGRAFDLLLAAWASGWQGAPLRLLKRHPLARALRADKLCLAGLQATLMHYLREEATEQIPVWRMIATSVEELDRRARRWRRALARAGIRAEIVDGQSTVGGGSLPGETLPTRLLALPLPDPNRIAEALRRHDPPVVARIEEDRLVLDPRTVLPEEEPVLLRALIEVLG
ncbi:MAG: L-seryl-tRNA(Sec) selenium transferase, partial [Anaerolineae bacterium]|nr:L-seryl-tRNA(Sec) selenium transferase [Anaerolineae bacterium]